MRDLLALLKKNNISVTLNNGDLKVKFNGEKLPDEILKELKERKSELLAYLQNLRNGPTQSEIDVLPPQADYVLSSSQRRIWILSQFEEANIAYNMSGVYVLEGDLDLGCLERSFAALIDRHEILRTVFNEDAHGEIKQQVKTSEDLHFSILQKERSTDQHSSADLSAEVESIIDMPFDLATGP
jgi:hypothetical protein